MFYNNICAFQVGRPVRIMLDRDEDMMFSGWRHPFYAKYKVGFNNDGLIQAVDVDMYNNAGFTIDLSLAVVERAVFHATNSYLVPNVKAKGNVCKTNLPSNTAFRGFGGPQGKSCITRGLGTGGTGGKCPPQDFAINKEVSFLFSGIAPLT